MRHPLRSFTLATALLAGAGACADSTGGGGGGTPPGDLNFLRLTDTAPPLCADSTGGWVKRDPAGQSIEFALVFPESGIPADCNGGSTEDFLRLKIEKDAIQRRPDGTLIGNGDSVFVWVKWVGNDSLLFDLQPSGLVFDPAKPADLKIEYGEAGEDLNDDGAIDVEDDEAETKLDMWRQEHPGDDFVRVGIAKLEDENEIEAKLNGLSRYAIAY